MSKTDWIIFFVFFALLIAFFLVGYWVGDAGFMITMWWVSIMWLSWLFFEVRYDR